MAASDVEGDVTAEEDPVHQMLKEKWSQTESKIDALFSGLGESARQISGESDQDSASRDHVSIEVQKSTPRAKKPARQIEDDYGDDDEDEDDISAHTQSPLHTKGKGALTNGIPPPIPRSPSLTSRPGPSATSAPSQDHGKSVEDVRKKLEEDRKAAEDAAKRSFHSMFYTLESDRDAMLEQQKLDELDRQVENEIGDGPSKAGEVQAANPAQGSLAQADLGASSLTLKNLIARIDAQRNKVRANDAQLRHLISEVRKGRSKWASEDKVGQEELYEAAEKVLMELKAMTEYSTPFLSRVNKRDAPDYFHIIKHPMDIGSMIKKLKGLQYKSKREFVGDLQLIWSNCLTYNADPNHPLRKKALAMRKETDKLVPLIPDITVRDRAEIEAEERRNQGLDNDLDGGEDSDDDRPIMASRGRKAPSKGKKGPTNSEARKTPKDDQEGTPAAEQKPAMHASTSSLRNEFVRGESDAPGGEHLSNGFATPPPGNSTPMVNGIHGSQADTMDVDSIPPAPLEELDEDDAEYKTWKQVTKKDRATAAADRHKLFRNDHLNPEEPAILRTKAGMRRWARQQKQYLENQAGAEAQAEADPKQGATSTGESLAEGIEKDHDKTLPDYYEIVTSIPGIADHLRWQEDDQGNVIPQTEQFLRLLSSSDFTSNSSKLTEKMENNMRQMQQTRKICAKIGYVKQLQIQHQSYQNQFPKYDPLPFIEQEIPALAVSEAGPIMAPHLARATFQRSVGKIFYHAGFEDFQPAALDAVTDMASHFFTKLVSDFNTFAQEPRRKSDNKPKFTAEEQLLHALHESGLDMDGLDSYVKEDMDRLGTKLGVVHERLKSHFTEILRPALTDNAGQDGAGAFNDGSEQFVGGDFAEDIDEDFFGFKELGLLEEFGMDTMSVPFHLLQNRLHSAYNANNAVATTISSVVFPVPEPYEPITAENVTGMIGLAQDFFASKLAAANGRPLVDDEDLPPKQRFPKPRLGPTGKISSPRKRPLREQQQAAKKKRKLEELKKGDNDKEEKKVKEIRPLKLDMPDVNIGGATNGDPEKEGGGGMMSPESIIAA
ncbi:Transcriptional activator spt7-like protein [Elsinoe fawcettii]|nr:Transcriptional activator spt7-like protein [Elsinoe fawcettii]